MRKLLLSTVSAAALLSLAACGDTDTAENVNEDGVAVEETAVDTTVPSAEEQENVADSDMAGEEMDGGMTDETATADAGTDADLEGDMGVSDEATASIDAEADAGIEGATQALADARDAISSESESAAVEALVELERAIDGLENPADAQQAVDATRNSVVEGDYEAALASLSDVEMIIENETTATTTE